MVWAEEMSVLLEIWESGAEYKFGVYGAGRGDGCVVGAEY
jgi:hypothetical protein